MSGVAIGLTVAGAANAGMQYSQNKAAAKAGSSKPDYSRAESFGFLGPKFAGDYFKGKATGAQEPLQMMALDQVVKDTSPWTALTKLAPGNGVNYGALHSMAPTVATKVSEVLTNKNITAPSTFREALGIIRDAPMGQQTVQTAPAVGATIGTAAAQGAMQYGTARAAQSAEDARWEKLYGDREVDLQRKTYGQP